MEIKDMLITNNRPGTKIVPGGVVVHWTANTDVGADAIANRNYFQNHPEAEVSAHYVVDDKNIIRCIPENEMAWHVGAKKYTDLKYNLLGNENPNKFLIGIEMCVNKDGDWNKTYKHAVDLVVDILNRYQWNISKLYRHYDITGKDCPRMMSPFVSGGEQAWNQFKKDVEGANKMSLEQWQKDLGVKAVNELSQKGLLTNPQDWLNQLEENTPKWLFFEMIRRLNSKIDVGGSK